MRISELLDRLNSQVGNFKHSALESLCRGEIDTTRELIDPKVRIFRQSAIGTREIELEVQSIFGRDGQINIVLVGED